MTEAKSIVLTFKASPAEVREIRLLQVAERSSRSEVIRKALRERAERVANGAPAPAA